MGQDIWFWSFHKFGDNRYIKHTEMRHICTYARRRHLSLAHDGDPMKWFWPIENSGPAMPEHWGRPDNPERGIRPESTDADGRQRGGLSRRIVWKHNLGVKLDLIQDQTSISSSRHLADFTGNITTGESLEEHFKCLVCADSTFWSYLNFSHWNSLLWLDFVPRLIVHVAKGNGCLDLL